MNEPICGKFIVLDGPDGSGKSTQHGRLEKRLLSLGIEAVSCRDPGGTDIGNRIRSILLDFDLSEMDVNCETMLFMASRAQLASEVIRPALAVGKTVLCDRYVTSTCAYQGAAGYDPHRVIELAKYALDGLWPDVTIMLDIDPESGFGRIGRGPQHAGKNRKNGQPELFVGSQPDAMEARSIEFHRRVRAIFLELHSYYPTPVITVNAGEHVDAVEARIWEALSGVLA
ncbi:MAG: dTMP kinase [Planctomycetes bacterium]|nr:dTMP kinase [Planctomycetota bacterium]